MWHKQKCCWEEVYFTHYVVLLYNETLFARNCQLCQIRSSYNSLQYVVLLYDRTFTISVHKFSVGKIFFICTMIENKVHNSKTHRTNCASVWYQNKKSFCSLFCTVVWNIFPKHFQWTKISLLIPFKVCFLRETLVSLQQTVKWCSEARTNFSLYYNLKYVVPLYDRTWKCLFTIF